ncbi:MAG: hypothetical protein GYA52_09020 [Chloroflexi bacterium]|nr:hypothetical protein [Chloroflexota bacterium]
MENSKIPLEEAWNAWKNCLNGKDKNSIFQQIATMFWDTAIFRLIVKGRQIQIEKKPEDPKINSALHSFIDRNYFQAQAAYIRRITDNSYDLTGKQGVYSINALIKNIALYREELTREEYFELRNIEYDYKKIEKAEKEFCQKQPLEKGFFIPHQYDWHSIVDVHKNFDRLSGTCSEKRTRKDKIEGKFFTGLQNKLSNCRLVTNHVDQYIAHSATPTSRKMKNVDANNVTFNLIWESQENIFKVADFLSLILFSEGHLALAIENPNFYKYWETPLFEKTDIEDIRTSLIDYRNETEKWSSEGTDQIWNWLDL